MLAGVMAIRDLADVLAHDVYVPSASGNIVLSSGESSHGRMADRKRALGSFDLQTVGASRLPLEHLKSTLSREA